MVQEDCFSSYSLLCQRCSHWYSSEMKNHHRAATCKRRLRQLKDLTKREATEVKPATGSSTSTMNTVRFTTEKCKEVIQKSLELPKVKFLREQLEKQGCKIGDNFIKAINCDQKVSGGYLRGSGMFICCNNMTFQDEINQVVIHELIHAYDDCRAKNMVWTDVAHRACAEIRAAHLSGDCHFIRELLRGYIKIRGHEQDCVKRRVLSSMMGSSNWSNAAAKDAMEAVWDVCYNDTQPFDKAP